MPDMNSDVRPIPDPTVLTTAANDRLEAILRDLVHAEITHQGELFNEKFATVALQFRMIDARTAEQKQDTNNALTSALTSQKEQAALQTISLQQKTDKSETATIERIKAVETLLAASTAATDDKITDIKDRVIAIESIKLGNAEGTIQTRDSGANARAILTSVIGVILALLAIAGFVVAILKP